MMNLITLKYLWNIVEGLWKDAYDAFTKDEIFQLRDSIEEFIKIFSPIGLTHTSSICEDLEKIKYALEFKYLHRERNWENLEIFKDEFGAYDDSHDIDLLPK